MESAAPAAIVNVVHLWVDKDCRERDSSMIETARMTPEPQRLRALERANEVRLARAELKRRIAEGDISAAEVILNSPWEARSWTVGDLLMSQRRWGRTRCRKFLLRHQISEVKQVGALTERQRRVLAGALETCPTDFAGVEAPSAAPALALA
jgi:hypothetical protein